MGRVDGHLVLALKPKFKLNNNISLSLIFAFIFNLLGLSDHPNNKDGENYENDTKDVEEDSYWRQVGVGRFGFSVGFVSKKLVV